MTWALFDYGNVLSFPHTDQDVENMAEVVGCPAAEFAGAYWQDRLDYDRGDLDRDTYWQKVGATLGRVFTPTQVAEVTRLDIASWLRLNPRAEALAADLAAAGTRLALLSNAPAEIAQVIPGLPGMRMFEHCLFSCHLRATKPDPSVYQATLARLRAEPADVVFLDDRPENVAGAEVLGIRAVLFTGPEQARAALAAYGVAGA